MAGRVVRARLGDRAHYQPIRSRLCDSSRIEDVVAALLELFPFRRLYIADLDALLGRPRQWFAIDAVRRVAPRLMLWLDAGLRTAAELSALGEHVTPVLASETLTAAAVEQLLAAFPSAVLSLDYRGDRPLGEPTFLERLQAWPADVIVMNLTQVGSGLGPDFRALPAVHRRAPQARVYVAGGIRDVPDLRRCCQAGAAGALVASVLHDGRIQRGDLERLR